MNSKYTELGYLRSGIPQEMIFSFPLGVDTDIFKVDGPIYPLETSKKFKFLFVGGTIFRKGIDKVLEAYITAFKPSDDVCLVVKDFGTRTFYAGQTYHEKILEASLDPNLPEILYIDDELAPNEMAALYRACDCLVHPYRGEGFGLPILEAMACGIPPIIPDLGPAVEFTSPKCSYRVKSKATTFSNAGDLRTALPAEIIDTDVPCLVKTMKSIVQHQELNRAVSLEAAQHAKQFTWSAIGDIVHHRLMGLQAKMTSTTDATQSGSFRELAKRSLRILERRYKTDLVSFDTYAPILLKGLHEHAHVLDVGTENCSWVEIMQYHGASVMQTEPSALVQLIDEAPCHKRHMEKFDVVFLRNVIEKFQPDTCLAIFLALLSRMSYRGRIFIVTTDSENSAVMSQVFWTNPANVRLYPASLITNLLIEAGFRVAAAGKMPGGVDSLVFGSRLSDDNPFS
ncbi:hypothetical protein Alches_27970 [Alicyclobacillus hesperidum subsp. aegles]|uniref:glycosyltransferase n=1 Tax=Alicyclobacillus hesperidum TaxID=89784 RepID=UPI00222D2025|nr:glycosyltransferase [Alicyclobacillus hesperidum]GLG02756.1 hypothetical protein Alches_27970 [Alicyclobacillus hesperidum subsp. aegles]